jgi:hypothetical protein
MPAQQIEIVAETRGKSKSSGVPELCMIVLSARQYDDCSSSAS